MSLVAYVKSADLQNRDEYILFGIFNEFFWRRFTLYSGPRRDKKLYF